MLTFSVKLALRLLDLDGKLGRLNLPVGADDSTGRDKGIVD